MAVKLEAQIKSEAGPVAKSSATLRNDADAAFRRADFRVGLQILGQIAATTPEDSANWLKLAKTIFQIRAASSSEQTFLYERASTAAYIAYQRAGNQAEEADALAVLGGRCPAAAMASGAGCVRLSLDMREVAEVRGQYEKMRDQHGFRLLDYTVDPTGLAAGLLPVLRGPRQAGRFRAVRGAGRHRQAGADQRGQAALRRRPETRRALQRQPARGAAVHRQGVLPKSAEFNIYVRDRKPFVRFTGPRLCAAAHRPARHSAGQRQYAVGERQRVPDRRPQPDQHGGGQRFPEDALQLPALEPWATSAA